MIQLILLLGSGWLLLTPPINTSDGILFEADDQQPYSQWDQYRAYDTARECETGKRDLRYKEIKRMLDEAEKRKAEKGRKAEQEAEQVQDNFRPSPYLLKLQTEANAALERTRQARCGANDPLGETESCRLMQKDLLNKFILVARQTEQERQRQETKEQTERRRNDFAKAAEAWSVQTKISARGDANWSARCIPSDVLSPTKR